jgi:hypothetical protein
MEIYEEQELAYLNRLTRQNRGQSHGKGPARIFPQWFGPCLRWVASCGILVILAHIGAIAGWIMHLGTVVLTFRFAFGVGRCAG